MVVEVFVAPVMPLNDFARLDAVAAARVLAIAISIIYPLLFEVRCGGFAVAECGPHVVAVGAGDWTLADEAGDVFGCQETIVDLMAPASWLDWGGEDYLEDGDHEEEE